MIFKVPTKCANDGANSLHGASACCPRRASQPSAIWLVGCLETAERLKATDQLVIGSTPEEAAARIAKDYAKWGAVTKKIGLSLE